MTRRRVLVVEDESDMLRFYHHFFDTLHPDEFEARLANSAEKALAALAKDSPEIAVLDWSLPGISGLDLLKALRASPKTSRIPVLMVAARNGSADTAFALEAGADDYVAKPFDENVLLARLHCLCRRQEREAVEQARLLQQLLQSQRMAAIGHLAAGVVHDFNNLLTTILGNSNGLLLNASLPKTALQDIKDINTAAQQAAEMARQLLNIGRRSDENDQEPADLNRIVAAIERTLVRFLGESIKLSLVLSPNLEPVAADKSRLAQALLNLVVNAKDAMPSGGRLLIESRRAVLDAESPELPATAKPGAYAVLRVSDTGVGMTPEVQERIFEPFFTTKKPGQGTGLGLSTIRKFADESGGFVSVRSLPGQGSSFSLYLPLPAANA